MKLSIRSGMIWESSGMAAAQFKVKITLFTQAMLALRAKLAAFKIGRHNFGFILDDALRSLAGGYIPTSFVPQKFRDRFLRDSNSTTCTIPHSDLMTYYGLELEESTVLTVSAVNFWMNLPVRHLNGFHKAYREVQVPQPVEAVSVFLRIIF